MPQQAYIQKISSVSCYAVQRGEGVGEKWKNCDMSVSRIKICHFASDVIFEQPRINITYAFP